jgi:hypothetical protein
VSAVATHLRDCPACRRLREEYLSLFARMRELRQQLAVPGPEIERRSLERWLADSRPALGDWIQSAIRNPQSAIQRVAVAAALALTVLGITLIRWHDHRAPGQPAPPLVQRSDSEQRVTPSHSQPSLFQNERRIAVSPPLASDRSGWQALSAGPSLPRGAEQPARSKLTLPRSQGSRPRDTGDLHTLNGTPEAPPRPWQPHSGDEQDRIEAQVRDAVPVRDDFVSIPFPRLAATLDTHIAAAVESYKREAAIVDARLAREVSLAFKATSLSDLCERLRADTGIRLEAGRSVADEKVTIFCKEMLLREVMRQLSRPFGYAWLRSGKPGEYRYELVQDLRSQLLEEELRNRARNEALLALDREMQRYRPYLTLSPDEALARSKSAPAEDKRLLENLAGTGWGPIQMYFRLSPQQLARLRDGQRLQFNGEPGPGEELLPPDLARGVLRSVRDTRLVREGSAYSWVFARDPAFSGALPPSAVPEARAYVDLTLSQSELGQYTLGSRLTGIGIAGIFRGGGPGPYAVGQSPAVLKPDNRAANERFARDPSLRERVSLRPEASCRPDPAFTKRGQGKTAAAEVKVTSADVLEALHQVSGLPIVADYYTRLYPQDAVSVREHPLFDALNQITDAMRLRWTRDGAWLQFRSTSYYDDRLKEVPNRLLNRWATMRRERGALPLDGLLEIAQLTDTQLDAAAMAEGARECFGLIEWSLARDGFFRPHLRYLAQLTPAQRQEARSAAGLAFSRMTLQQQQQFIALAIGSETDRIRSLEDLAAASLRVAYTQPGEFQWAVPEERIGLPGHGIFRISPVRLPTRPAALHAARRIDPGVEESQIVPTELAVTVVYTVGTPDTGFTAVLRHVTPTNTHGSARRLPLRDRPEASDSTRP